MKLILIETYTINSSVISNGNRTEGVQFKE